jgi:hypothetical protein
MCADDSATGDLNPQCGKRTFQGHDSGGGNDVRILRSILHCKPLEELDAWEGYILSRNTCSFVIVFLLFNSKTRSSMGWRWTRFTRTKNLYKIVRKNT